MAKRFVCTDCGSSDGLAEYEDHTYCFSCNITHKNIQLYNKSEVNVLNIPKANVNCLPRQAYDYIFKYFDLDANHVNCFWSQEYNRLCFPFYEGKEVIACWMRSLNENPKWLYVGPKKDTYCWHLFKDINKSTQFVAIVEDVISAIKCSKFIDTICLGGTNTDSYALYTTLLKYKQVISFFDGDEAGRKASATFTDKFKILRPIKEILGYKDPKDYSNEELKETLQWEFK